MEKQMFNFEHIEEVNQFGSKISKEYKGFTAKICPIRLKDNILVIAWWDSEPDYWIVDLSDNGIEQLQEYYNDMIGEVPPFTFLKEMPC
jgi:hypothetical protein